MVAIAVVDNRAIIAGEHEHGVLCEAEAVEGSHDFAYRPIQFQDRVTTGAHATLADEAGVRNAWDVDVVGGEIEEEGLAGVVLYELD